MIVAARVKAFCQPHDLRLGQSMRSAFARTTTSNDRR
jgi:hypothetical protein